MAEEKVYSPEVIEETPFPGADEHFTDVSQSTSNDTYSPQTIKNNKPPTRRIATELIGQALNTRSKKILQEFELTQSGGFQVGNYKEGTSGDLRITPNGLTARDVAGVTTFAIDGDSGDAVFKGTIQAGAVVSGLVQVGGDNMTLDGEQTQFILRDENGVAVLLIGYQENGF